MQGMSNGQKYVNEALKHEGVREATGRNDGEPIETWQKRAEAKYSGYGPGSLRGAPWCGIFTSAMSDDAGVNVPAHLTHPFTGYACQEINGAKRVTGTIPVGSIFVKCSTHVGIVVRDRGSVVDTIEGNFSNSVRRGVRSKSDWRFYTWPNQGTTGPAPPRLVESYGFDNNALKPITYGPWSTTKARDERMEAFKRERDLADQWGPVAVELDKSGPRYAFRVGQPGVPYKDRNGNAVKWRFGGWSSKATREKQRKQYEANNPGAKIRTWMKKVPGPTGNSTLSEGSVT